MLRALICAKAGKQTYKHKKNEYLGAVLGALGASKTCTDTHIYIYTSTTLTLHEGSYKRTVTLFLLLFECGDSALSEICG